MSFLGVYLFMIHWALKDDRHGESVGPLLKLALNNTIQLQPKCVGFCINGCPSEFRVYEPIMELNSSQIILCIYDISPRL